VVSAAQARSLLAAVRAPSERGQHLEAFFACLSYAALRPSEAVMLRESDLYLPKKGWGRIVLAASASRAGTAWTDDGTARQERGLRRRADNDTRTIPIPPELVRLLRAHIKRYDTTPDGRIFQTARGGILQDSGYNEVWTEARKTASPSPSPALAMKEATTASRHPEVAGQRPDAERKGRYTASADGQHTAPALAVRARPWIPRPRNPVPTDA
jgi:integrase